MIKVAFFGTPNIGAAALNSLLRNDKIEVVVVITTVDKPVGRSHTKLIETPVATLARDNNIDVIKTNSINNDIKLLTKYEYDYILTCAFGQFLSDDVLQTPNKKALNIHGSLLPEGRGGAPLHWAIINGKQKTGISIMEMVSKMDAGDYYDQYELSIEPNENVDTLFERMSDLIEDKSAEGLLKVDDGAQPMKQKESDVSFWMNVTKDDAKVNFDNTIEDIHNKIRGLDSKPGAWAYLDGKRVKIHKSLITAGNRKDFGLIKPGKILDAIDEGLLVKVKRGTILIQEITIEGQKRKKITRNDHNFIGKVFE